jgi:hypothetical protein
VVAILGLAASAAQQMGPHRAGLRRSDAVISGLHDMRDGRRSSAECGYGVGDPAYADGDITAHSNSDTETFADDHLDDPSHNDASSDLDRYARPDARNCSLGYCSPNEYASTDEHPSAHMDAPSYQYDFSNRDATANSHAQDCQHLAADTRHSGLDFR